MDPRAPPPNRARARRARARASRGRSDRRTPRRLPRSRAGRRDVRANAIVILYSRRGLEARARVHRPRANRLDRVTDVVRAEPAREHHALPDCPGAFEVRHVPFLPWKVDDAGHFLALPQEHRVPAAHLSLLVLVELHEVRLSL